MIETDGLYKNLSSGPVCSIPSIPKIKVVNPVPRSNNPIFLFFTHTQITKKTPAPIMYARIPCLAFDLYIANNIKKERNIPAARQ